MGTGSDSSQGADLDREICLCFHVTRRKIANFVRIERPRRVSQISECFGAGTGCGWCRPFLKRLFDEAATEGQVTVEMPDRQEYARLRGKYVRQGGGTPPPGATPVEEESGEIEEP